MHFFARKFRRWKGLLLESLIGEPEVETLSRWVQLPRLFKKLKRTESPSFIASLFRPNYLFYLV